MEERWKIGDMITSYKFLNGSDEVNVEQFFNIRNDRVMKRYNRKLSKNMRGYSRKLRTNQVTKDVEKYFYNKELYICVEQERTLYVKTI